MRFEACRAKEVGHGDVLQDGCVCPSHLEALALQTNVQRLHLQGRFVVLVFIRHNLGLVAALQSGQQALSLGCGDRLACAGAFAGHRPLIFILNGRGLAFVLGFEIRQRFLCGHCSRTGFFEAIHHPGDLRPELPQILPARRAAAGCLLLFLEVLAGDSRVVGHHLPRPAVLVMPHLKSQRLVKRFETRRRAIGHAPFDRLAPVGCQDLAFLFDARAAVGIALDDPGHAFAA